LSAAAQAERRRILEHTNEGHLESKVRLWSRLGRILLQSHKPSFNV
jgi:hypothetical protein